MAGRRLVGFVGNAGINRANAESLLDDWLPADTDQVTALVPDQIPRTGGMRTVRDLLHAWTIHVHTASPDQILDDLSHPDGAEPTLVSLYDPADEETEALMRRAAESGVPVLALTDALNDVSFEPEEPKTYGKPREQAVQAEVPGPATIIGHGIGQILEQAIRQIVREELQMLGHYAHVEMEEARPAPQKVKAWTDGTAYMVPTAKRAPKGWRTVELSEDELAARLREPQS